MNFNLNVEKWHKVTEEGFPEDGAWCFVAWLTSKGEMDWSIGGYYADKHNFYVNYGLGGLVLDEEDVVA